MNQFEPIIQRIDKQVKLNGGSVVKERIFNEINRKQV